VTIDTSLVSNIRHEATNAVLWQSYWEVALENEESFFDSGDGSEIGFHPFELDVYDVIVDQIEREEREEACPEKWEGLYSSTELDGVPFTSFTDTPALTVERDFEVYRQGRISAKVTKDGEEGIGDASVELFDDDEQLRQETETDTWGNFHFCGVDATSIDDTVPESPQHYEITIDHQEYKKKTTDTIVLNPGELEDLGTLELDRDTRLVSNIRHKATNSVLWQSDWEVSLENEQSYAETGAGNDIQVVPFQLDVYDVTVDQINREEREDDCPDKWEGLYSSLDLDDINLTTFTDTPDKTVERDFEVYRQSRISAKVTEDGDTNIGNATVKLYDDFNLLRQQTETNFLGNFHFCGVDATNFPDTVPESPSHYKITIDHPDYQKKTIDNIELDPGELEDLGTLELDPTNNPSNSSLPFHENNKSMKMGFFPWEKTSIGICASNYNS